MSEFPIDQLPYIEIPVNEHVSLRQLRPTDADELFAVTDANRDYLGQWLPWVENTKSPADSRAFIEQTLQDRQTGAEYGYGIMVDGKLAGHTTLMHVTDDRDPEIGYWIAKDAAGGGRTTAAAAALTEFGLQTLGLPKVIIRADSNNAGSNRVAEKLGYQKETEIPEEDSTVTNVWAKYKS